MVLLLHFAIFPIITATFFTSSEKIRLTDIEVLTFYKDSYTTGRRTSIRPQIECRSGCNTYYPEELQCYNRGFDGTDVNWECRGNLPNGLKLSNVVVGCEGYDYPTDPYILRGSCQVIVSLQGDDWQYQRKAYYPQDSGDSLNIWSIVFVIGVIYMLLKIFQIFWTQAQVPQQIYGYPLAPSTGTSQFWSNLGWASFFGSMFAPRWRTPFWSSRRGYGVWGNRNFQRPFPPKRETQTSYARTERR